MDMTQLFLIGAIIFGAGILYSWKFKKRASPEEKAIYDAAYAEARKGALKRKAIEDATRDAVGGGMGGALQKFAKGFADFQEEGRKLNLPSLLDYDKDEDYEKKNRR